MPKVYVHLLTWNDRRYLPDLFDSLETQNFKDFVLRVLDNGSSDETLPYLQKRAPQSLAARNVKNRGFAPGHNQLLRYTLEHLAENERDPFILLLNSDMVLHPDMIGTLVGALAKDASLAAVQPKLYRAFGEVTGDNTLSETTLSDVLDTTGLSLKRGWRMADRGAGELDEGQYDHKLDIFGPTGTCSMFRVSALKDMMFEDEIFDDDFFAYREDCDLAWRLRKRGWKSQFVPAATAHHYRGMYGAEKQSLWKRLLNRRGQRPFFAALSTRNQLFMLLKNLRFSDFLRHSPRIVLAEGGRVAYGFVFEKATRKRLLGMWSLIPRMLKKRRHIFKHTRTPDATLLKYVE